MKFKIGDIVRISHPQFTELSNDGIGKIVCYRYINGKNRCFPYRIRFLDSRHVKFNEINETPYMIFDDSELTKLDDKEAFAWLI